MGGLSVLKCRPPQGRRLWVRTLLAPALSRRCLCGAGWGLGVGGFGGDLAGTTDAGFGLLAAAQ
jgi:hypothetical protein